MAIKETTASIKKLLSHISHDIEKAEKGNKAASQRVRTNTVRLEKLAKLYRKESIAFDKKNKGTRKSSSSSKKAAHPAKKMAAKAKGKTKTFRAATARPRP